VSRREDRAGRHELDHVRTGGDLLADRLRELVRSIGLPVHALPRGRTGRGDRDDFPGEHEARSARETLRDRPAEPKLEVISAANVADGREPGGQSPTRVLGDA